MRTKLLPLAVLAMVAMIGASCSNAPAETGTDNSTDTAHEMAMKFAQCMRDNGVKDFPDPGPSGELTVDGVLNGTSLDPSSAAWKSAINACKGLEPPGFTGQKRSAEDQKAALQFAQCIRDNGVKDFPDPTPDGPLVDTNRIPSSGTTSGMNALNAAMQKSRDYAVGAGVTGAGANAQ
jgi:hypothetical protein